MPADSHRAARARIRRARARSFAPLFVVVGLIGAGALAAIPLGGWDEVELESARIPTIEPGDTFTSVPFAVAVHSVGLLGEHPDGFTDAEPGMIWMAVEATFENRLEFPVRPPATFGFTAFSVDGVELERSARIDAFLDRDGNYLPALNPGISDDFTFLLPVPDGRFSDGDVVTVQLWDAERQRAEIYNGIRWWQPHVAVEVPIVLEDRR